MIISKDPYTPTEGEEFLQDFFNSEGIKFESQRHLASLKADSKAYRIADFYLPKYKVYVEFCGMWNQSEEKKAEYKEKMVIYRKNAIPCIFIFPENLGIIHYVFNKRIRAELKKYRMNKELYRYNLEKLVEDRIDSIIALAFWILLIVAIFFDRDAELFWQTFIVLLGLIVHSAWKIWKGYKKYFLQGYSFVGFQKVY
jgi:hypothetical protein